MLPIFAPPPIPNPSRRRTGRGNATVRHSTAKKIIPINTTCRSSGRSHKHCNRPSKSAEAVNTGGVRGGGRGEIMSFHGSSSPVSAARFTPRFSFFSRSEAKKKKKKRPFFSVVNVDGEHFNEIQAGANISPPTTPQKKKLNRQTSVAELFRWRGPLRQQRL